MNKIRFGVLGAAKIATRKVIPGMQRGQFTEIAAIASRDADRARAAAGELNISKHYGSYEELLADPEIDAVYNPLPNHLHVPWSIKAAKAGKHVLCEKPIALNAREALELKHVRDETGVKMAEAFMVYCHPAWIRARELAQSGELGDLRAIVSVFSYFNADPANIRNQADIGGGALMDIGCYPVTMSRFLFGREPERVAAAVERDPALGTDRLTSAILDYGSGHCIFICSTQMVPFQTIQVLGSKRRLELQIPYNIPPDEPLSLYLDDGSQLGGRSATKIDFPALDQYTLQGDLFARAILEGTEVPVPLENAAANMAVIDALFRAAETGQWVNPEIS